MAESVRQRVYNVLKNHGERMTIKDIHSLMPDVTDVKRINSAIASLAKTGEVFKFPVGRAFEYSVNFEEGAGQMVKQSRNTSMVNAGFDISVSLENPALTLVEGNSVIVLTGDKLAKLERAIEVYKQFHGNIENVNQDQADKTYQEASQSSMDTPDNQELPQAELALPKSKSKAKEKTEA